MLASLIFLKRASIPLLDCSIDDYIEITNPCSGSRLLQIPDQHQPPPVVPKHHPISAQPFVVEFNSGLDGCFGNKCRTDQPAGSCTTSTFCQRMTIF